MKKPETMENEGHVKDAIKAVLALLGAWHYMHVPVGYGRTGIPDFTVVLAGRPVMIEAKFSMRETTGRQEEELDKAAKAGAVSMVVNQWGLEDMALHLVKISKGHHVPGIYRYQYKKALR